MNRCIKCGREIPDGELFCVECSLNPGSSLFEEPKAPERAAPKGRMQAPAPARRPRAPKPAPKQPERSPSRDRRKHSSPGLVAAVVILSALVVSMLGLAYWKYDDFKAAETRLETKEADMLLRDHERLELAAQVEDLNDQIETLSNTLEAKEQEIKALESRLSGSQSTQTQSEFDLTTKEAELKELAGQNQELVEQQKELQKQVEDLSEQLAILKKEGKRLREKADFMDKYVVFVENDGSGLYHTYDCGDFPQQSFWAYSRKLAESNGFSPCPRCGGGLN